MTTTYEWVANRLHVSRDALGNERRVHYDEMGLVRKVIEPSPNDPSRPDLPPGAPTGAVETLFDYAYPGAFAYPGCTEAAHDPAAVISPAGRCHLAAELTRITTGANVGGQERVTDYVYDGDGNMTAMTQRGDAANPDRTTTLGWEANGILATVDGPLPGPADVTTYGTDGQPNRGYHRAGLATAITDAAGSATTRTYTARGSVATVVDRDGRASAFAHDAAERVSTATNPEGAATTFGYDANGNRRTQTSAGGLTTTWTHDVRDRVSSVDGPGPTTTSSTYHPDGTTATQTAAAGGVHRFEHWPNGALRRITAPPTAGAGRR